MSLSSVYCFDTADGGSLALWIVKSGKFGYTYITKLTLLSVYCDFMNDCSIEIFDENI